MKLTAARLEKHRPCKYEFEKFISRFGERVDVNPILAIMEAQNLNFTWAASRIFRLRKRNLFWNLIMQIRAELLANQGNVGRGIYDIGREAEALAFAMVFLGIE